MPRATASTSAGAEQVGRPAPQSERTDTIPHLFWSQVRRYGADKAALRHKELGIWREISWQEYGASVRACACGLLSLGVEHGDRVAVLSEDRPEWLYSHLGIQSVGAATVGLYPSSASAQCAHLAGHSESRVWIVEDEEQYDKAMEVRQELPDLEWIVVIDTRGLNQVDDPAVIGYAELMERGRELDRGQPDLYGERLEGVSSDDVAVLLYTSGTTGPPKGAIHAHGPFLAGHQLMLRQFDWTDEDEFLCYMPLCHIGENYTSFLTSLTSAITVSFVEKAETLFQDLQEVAPTYLFAFPRIWERLMARTEIGVAEATWLKRMAYRMSMRVGHARSRYMLSSASVPLYVRASYCLADVCLFRTLRKRLGLGRVRSAGVAAAPISPQVLEYFHAIGIPIREAFGLTEGGISTVMPADRIKLGTKGPPIGGIELRIGDEGEILFRGPGLFKGYYKQPKETAEALRDGWLHTGDQGHIDDEGYLVLTGRIKDLIVLSTGHNVAPQELENRLKASSYIMDAVVVGEAKPYLTALIIIDEETVAHYAQTRSIPFSTFADLTQKREVVALIDADLQKVNEDFAERDQVRRFRVLEWELNREEEELTPTMKVRRQFLCDRYAGEIDAMYSDTEV